MHLIWLIMSLTLISLTSCQFGDGYPIFSITDRDVDELLSHTNKPWFILVTDDWEAFKDTFYLIMEKYNSTLYLGHLHGQAYKDTTRRLKVSSYPTYLYSEDGKNFIHHLLPKDYEGLVEFLERGYKRVPKYRYRSFDPPTLWIYLYESAIELPHQAIDMLSQTVGLGKLSHASKRAISVGLIMLLLGIVALVIYSCVMTEIRQRKAVDKKLQ